MKIQVLGSGCPTCKKLHGLTNQAVKELGIGQEVEYITDIQKMLEMGVMSSPVLAIDGKPVIVGSVPDIEKIKNVIEENSTK
ncbi:MAG: thioredoxin family protein [Candidatus Berkelbacteria bacterium]|nr:thioredoxin family protein [Candidatus Berkelbacteria bacterium]